MRDTIHSWCEHIVSKKVRRLISFICHFSYFFCLLLGQTPLRFPLTSSNFKWSIKHQTQSVSPPDEIPRHLIVYQMRDTIHSWCEHIVSKKVRRLISFICHFSYFFCLLLGQTPLRFPLTSSNFKWSIKHQTQSVSPPDEIPRRDTVSNAWYYFSNKIFLLFSKSNC